MNFSFIQNWTGEQLFFGGYIVITLALIGLVAIMAKQYFNQSKHYYNHTNEVINKNTEAWVMNAKSNQKLVDVIDKWHKK